MPERIEYCEDNIGVIVYNDGIVTGDELFNTLVQIYEDARYPSLKYWIGDISKAEKLIPSVDDIKRLAQLNIKESLRNPGMLLAIVAESRLTYGMARMFQTYNEESAFRTRIFRDRKCADEWIMSEIEQDKALKSET